MGQHPFYNRYALPSGESTTSLKPTTGSLIGISIYFFVNMFLLPLINKEADLTNSQAE